LAANSISEAQKCAPVHEDNEWNIEVVAADEDPSDACEAEAAVVDVSGVGVSELIAQLEAAQV
jgi:hypothetical protein